MKRRGGLLLIVCLALAACQQSGRGGEGDGGASIDGFQFGQTFYARWTDVTAHPAGVRPLRDSDLGPVVDRVVANRANEPVESGTPFRNLEATFLKVGTPIYAVKGYSNSFRLAARRDGKLGLYEPWESPTARVGADLLGGIDGKVRRIGIYADHGLRPLGTISDRRRVEGLVDLAMQAPVEGQDPANSKDEYELYVLTFHLADGTGVSRLFNAATGFLAGGVVVPKPFTAAIIPCRGTSEHQRAAIGDGIYRALVEVANMPEGGRFQVISDDHYHDPVPGLLASACPHALPRHWSEPHD